ncbi:hypothetical protein BJX96DRAFT_155358 [Aspergillus floccosus]
MAEMKKPLGTIPIIPAHLTGAHHTVHSAISGHDNAIDTHAREALKHEREALHHEREALRHEREALLAGNKHKNNPQAEPYAMATAFLSIRGEVEKTLAAEKEEMQQEIAELKAKVNEKDENIARVKKELVEIQDRFEEETENHYSECQPLCAKLAKLRLDLTEKDECGGCLFGDPECKYSNWPTCTSSVVVPSVVGEKLGGAL